MRYLLVVSMLLFGVLGGLSSAYASWPSDCGNLNQKTCTTPIHHGCKDGLEKCDMPYGRDICREKGHCPGDSRNKNECSDCGHDGQAPCLFKKYCHMCSDSYHVSHTSGKCVKTDFPSPQSILEGLSKQLGNYEKDCHSFIRHLEQHISLDVLTTLQSHLNVINLETHILSEELQNKANGLALTCSKEAFSGFACAVNPWLKGYVDLGVALLDSHGEDVKGAGKEAQKLAKRFIDNFINNKICLKVTDPAGRAFCAAVATITNEAKEPIECAGKTIVTLASDVKKDLKKVSNISDSAITKFVGHACYDISQFGITIALDQSIALISAGAAEGVSIPKDMQAVYSLAKTIVKAKLELEAIISDAQQAKAVVQNNSIKETMSHYNHCKPVLNYLKD